MLKNRNRGSEIPSYLTAIRRIVLPIVLLQVRLFTQNLAVEQPRGGHEVDLQNDIGEDQKLT